MPLLSGFHNFSFIPIPDRQIRYEFKTVIKDVWYDINRFASRNPAQPMAGGDAGLGRKGHNLYCHYIALIAILALGGTVGVLTTTTEVKISSNYKTNAQSLYVAQAGRIS